MRYIDNLRGKGEHDGSYVVFIQTGVMMMMMMMMMMMNSIRHSSNRGCCLNSPFLT